MDVIERKVPLTRRQAFSYRYTKYCIRRSTNTAVDYQAFNTWESAIEFTASNTMTKLCRSMYSIVHVLVYVVYKRASPRRADARLRLRACRQWPRMY